MAWHGAGAYLSASAASPPLYRSPLLPPTQASPLSFPILLRPKKGPDDQLKMRKNKDNDSGNYIE